MVFSVCLLHFSKKCKRKKEETKERTPEEKKKKKSGILLVDTIFYVKQHMQSSMITARLF